MTSPKKSPRGQRGQRWAHLLGPVVTDPVLARTLLYGLGRGIVDLGSAEDLEAPERVKLARMNEAWEVLERLIIKAEGTL